MISYRRIAEIAVIARHRREAESLEHGRAETAEGKNQGLKPRFYQGLSGPAKARALIRT
jgi:hypothetical protein